MSKKQKEMIACIMAKKRNEVDPFDRLFTHIALIFTAVLTVIMLIVFGVVFFCS